MAAGRPPAAHDCGLVLNVTIMADQMDEGSLGEAMGDLTDRPVLVQGFNYRWRWRQADGDEIQDAQQLHQVCLTSTYGSKFQDDFDNHKSVAKS